MDLIRFEPAFRGLEKLSDQLNRFFLAGRPNGVEENLTVADWTPAVDIQELEKEYLVKAEIPEVKKEDVKVMVEEGVLSVQGERRQEKEEKGKKFHRVERSYGSFLRSFTLPADADENKISAEFADGMLKIHLPKSETAKPKAIEIKFAVK
jgi:HSP20 family protein